MSPSNDSPGAQREQSSSLITAFVTMHTFVWISSIVIILTVILSPNIHRQSTWINLNLSWIITCFVFAFLLTSGQLFNANPDSNVCLFQAAGVNAVTSLTAGTMLALALQLWFNINPNSARRESRLARRRDILLITVPYIVPLIEFLASVGYAVQNRQEVVLTDSGMFCGMTNPTLRKISAIYSAVLMIPTVVFLVLLSVYVYRNRLQLSGTTIIIRFGLFILFGVVGTIASVIDLTDQADSSVANILESLPPVSFVLIFGLQEDLLRVWMFWRAPPKKSWHTRLRSPPQSYSSEIELGQTRPMSATKTSWTDV
ncbi:hypothetical protein GYMLUDRAFT_39463 [Collybiopsis luxurians FD-317 M1]|nr:hypothetical protein GYMLUDRAFT_39463 [Collybiopsis luxurians FD-317 M1]